MYKVLSSGNSVKGPVEKINPYARVGIFFLLTTFKNIALKDKSIYFA